MRKMKVRYINRLLNKLLEREISSSITLRQDPVTIADLYKFGHTIIVGCCSAAYAIVFQLSGFNQSLIRSQRRFSKKGVAIPRPKLIVMHMAPNFSYMHQIHFT